MLRSLVLAGLAALAACSGESGAAPAASSAGPREQPAADWPIYRGSPALRGVAVGALRARPQLLWTHATGGAITSSPVVAGGTVYVGSDDGSIHAVDLHTGATRWTFPTDDIVEAPPLFCDGRIYVGSSDFFFYCLSADTGELQWKVETQDKILGGANRVRLPSGESLIVVGSYDNNLYGFDAGTGATRWVYETDNYVNGTPAVLGDRVVFGGCDAVLHVVSAATGESLEKVDLGADSHVAGSVGLIDDEAYLGHYGNAFVCVDLAAGQVRWAYRSPRDAFFSSPAIADDRVVFGGRDRMLHCARRRDGVGLWTFRTGRKVDGSPVVCGDKVVFGSGDGRLYLLSLADGHELWRYDIGQSVFSSPAVAGGFVVVGSHDGRLYAFDARPEPVIPR